MSNFWSGWVIALVLINYVTIFFLFLWARKVEIPTESDGTTGHSWSHGAIREGLHPLPKWWLILSTAAFISAAVYLIFYPGFGSWKGTLGWTSTKQLHGEIVSQNTKGLPLLEQINSQSVLALTQNAAAMQVGKRIFEDNCAACHGYDAKGRHEVGAPNLTDNTWLFGGKSDEIIHTITEGHNGSMPAWQTILSPRDINEVSNYVLGLSGVEHDSIAAASGEAIFVKTCQVCHGEKGIGNPAMGAPNLSDTDWIYGGDAETVIATITHGRNGHMPAWKGRLNPQQIKVVAAWVLSHNNTEIAVAAGEK